MRYKLVDECEVYQVQADDTLTSIAEDHNGLLKDLVLCNWGTEDSRVVCRALFEEVGLREYLKDYADAVFAGDETDRGSGEILLPGEWTREGLSIDAVHNITVRKPMAAPAIRIDSLDKWFVPGPSASGGDLEPIEYSLEGSAERADTVAMEVFASNYCSAQVDDEGKITYEAIAETPPIFTCELLNLRETLNAKAENGDNSEEQEPTGALSAGPPIKDWYGQSTATTGMLAPRGSDDRYVNVAFSPYTVLLRLYKDANDAEARILLEDFWPRWDDNSNLEPDSLKVKWKIENCSKLKHGTLRIVDCSDEVVYVAALNAEALNSGEFTWDGTWESSTGRDAQPYPDKMPYRVQIEARSGRDEMAGVALAVSHSEVRLYANTEAGDYSGVEDYKNPNSLRFGLASWVAEGTEADPLIAKVPDQASDEVAWYQYTLAEAGFHPGPVTGTANDQLEMAISEFQRSMPKNTGRPYERLEVTGSADRETTQALTRLSANARPILGNPHDDRKPFATPADAITALNMNYRPSDIDRAPGEVIVWVDDRHYYTRAAERRSWLPPTLQDRANAPMIMGDYDGAMVSTNDDHMRRDQQNLMRPWLPLEVDFPIRRADADGYGLSSMSRAPVDETTRQVIGPFQVNWTFEEVGEDLDRISPIDPNTGVPADYDETAVRSRAYVETIVADHQATHEGKVFVNCPEKIGGQTIGGIRPDDLTTYYKVPFGTGEYCLKPWTVTEDAANEQLITFVHDDVGQAEGELYALRRGRAGIYFNPSTIAGDGYRVRAALSFDAPPEGADFPNREVLQRRYSVLPKAHTANLRIWRRMSFRAVIAWLPMAIRSDDVNILWVKDRYARSFVHAIVDAGPDEIENGIAEFEMTSAAGPPSTWTEADSLLTESEYQGVVAAGLRGTPYRRNPVTLHPTTMWPFTSMPSSGFPAKSGLFRDTPNPAGRLEYKAWNDMMAKISTRTKAVVSPYMRDLAIFLLKNLEERSGRHKGFTVVYTMYTPAIALQQYVCSNPGCNLTFAEIVGVQGATTLHSLGTACPSHRDDNGDRCRNGTWRAFGVLQVREKGINHFSVGLALGVSLLNATHDRQLWPHEIGHNKHLQHGRSCTWGDAPGGFTDSQHDVAVNTPFAPLYAGDDEKDRRWDRLCIMGYTNGSTVEQFFCGKCLLKNRGWAIEPIDDPPGNVYD